MILSAVLLIIGSLTAQAEDISLIGKLTKIPSVLGHCGWAKVSSMTEYEVIRLSSGVYTNPKIYVVHDCMELPRPGLKRFKVGDFHKLVLSTEDPDGTENSRITAMRLQHLNGGDIRPKDHKIYYCKLVEKYWKLLWLHN